MRYYCLDIVCLTSTETGARVIRRLTKYTGRYRNHNTSTASLEDVASSTHTSWTAEIKPRALACAYNTSSAGGDNRISRVHVRMPQIHAKSIDTIWCVILG